jgi:two-component system sensor histidine kinase VanS
LLDDSGRKIELKPELEAMQNKLNAVKTALIERKNAALESEQRKNDLVVYLAHDLKTPLTSVIGYLSLLKDAPDLPAAQRAKYTDITLNKALQLEGYINEFFDITRFNLQNIQLNLREVNLSVLLDQLTDEFYPVLCQKGMKVNAHTGDRILIQGDAEQLARVFGNLLKNAYLYGNENSDIEVAAEMQDGSVAVRIRNHGPVLSEFQLKSIFEKFYRADPARSAGGTGLGLAIAKKIVELHGGTICASSSSEYTEFAVMLPFKN